LTNKKELLLDDKLIVSNTDSLGYFLNNNAFAFYDENFDCLILETFKNKTINLGKINIQSIKVNNSFVAYIYDNEYNSKLILIDEINYNVHYINAFYNIILNLFYNTFGFHKLKDRLDAYLILENSLLWSHDFSYFPPYNDDWGDLKPAEIENIIGVYDNKLWLHISYQKIVALDIENGSLLHQIQLNDHLSLPYNSQDGLYVGDLHLDESNGIIKSLSDRYYFELDLKNLQAVIKKDFGKDHSNNWRIKRSRFYEGDKNLYLLELIKERLLIGL